MRCRFGCISPRIAKCRRRFPGDTLIEAVAFIRSFAGKLGFAAAGIALVATARYRWRVGGALRRVSPLTATQGVAMQFNWVDSASIACSTIGPTFIAWLVAIGGMLATGRAERPFRDMVGSASKRDYANAN